MVVVLPTPFTPITRMIEGFVSDMQLLIAARASPPPVSRSICKDLGRVGNAAVPLRAFCSSSQMRSAVADADVSAMIEQLFQLLQRGILIDFRIGTEHIVQLKR